MARRDKNIAKNEIFGAFRESIERTHEKVTISHVIATTGFNRKTFYNHFASQDELVAWGFRRDLLDALLKIYPMDELMPPAADRYDFTDLPCYHRTISGPLTLNQSDYFSIFFEVFGQHRSYYRSIFRLEYGLQLRRYIISILNGLFAQDLEYFLNGRIMPAEAKDFVAAFYAEAIANTAIDSFLELVDCSYVSAVSPINNIAHEGMQHMVELFQSIKAHDYLFATRI